MLLNSNVHIRDYAGRIIPAILQSGDNSDVCVLIAHGIMGSKNEYLNTSARIAELLALKNIASLRIDFYGHGDSSVGLQEFCFASQVENLMEGMRFLMSKGFKQIICMGISYGAPPSIQIADIYSEYVKGIVLIAPVIDNNMTFLFPTTNWGIGNFGIKNMRSAYVSGGLKLDESYVLPPKAILDMMSLDINMTLSRISKPIYIFHGNRDDMVPLDASKKISEIYNNITLTIMDKTEHGLTEVGDLDFTSRVSYDNLYSIINCVYTI